MLAEWPNHLTSDVIFHIIQVTVHNKAQDLHKYESERRRKKRSHREQRKQPNSIGN